jgi:hypothetical protein
MSTVNGRLAVVKGGPPPRLRRFGATAFVGQALAAP